MFYFELRPPFASYISSHSTIWGFILRPPFASHISSHSTIWGFILRPLYASYILALSTLSRTSASCNSLKQSILYTSYSALQQPHILVLRQPHILVSSSNIWYTSYSVLPPPPVQVLNQLSGNSYSALKLVRKLRQKRVAIL